jgi:hypothetical protein
MGKKGIKVQGTQRTGTNYLRELLSLNIDRATVLSQTHSFGVPHTWIPSGKPEENLFYDLKSLVQYKLPDISEGILKEDIIWLMCTKHPYLLLFSGIKYSEYNKPGSFDTLSSNDKDQYIINFALAYNQYAYYVNHCFNQGYYRGTWIPYESLLTSWKVVLANIALQAQAYLRNPPIQYTKSGLPGGSTFDFDTYKKMYIDDKVHMKTIEPWKDLLDFYVDWRVMQELGYARF